jgi:hypothetical protein
MNKNNFFGKWRTQEGRVIFKCLCQPPHPVCVCVRERVCVCAVCVRALENAESVCGAGERGVAVRGGGGFTFRA